MMRKGCISYNASSFLAGFRMITSKVIPDVAGKALFQTGWMIIRYANTKKPMTPRDIGDLRGSGRVEPDPQKLEVTVGFDKEYAAKWHELSSEEERHISWTTPGSGRKYLEAKLSMYKNDFIRFAAEYIGANAFK